MGPISVTVVDANNITLEVTPTPTTVVEIDRGVAGNGIVSIVPVTISTLQYLRITYTNGTVSDVGPLTSTAYFGQSPIDIVGNTISLSTVPVQLGGTGATTASSALSNLGGIGTITSTDGSITVTPAGTTVNLAVSEASPASTVLTPVRNTTGATLTKGTVVYISGATGQIATVSKALASSDATSAQTLGMITSDLPNNTNGYVTVFGLILDIDTSAYADGAQLYLSGTTAGAVTATKPSAPTHLVYVAVVEYSHAVHGKLLVKVQNGYELDELHNVSITSPATGQTIIYDSGTGLWSNSTVSLTAGVNGTLPIGNGGTGATTAAGAATNLGLGTGNSPTFTGLTLSGGTANGVAYLNGSKVLTTGSALTFDGNKVNTTKYYIAQGTLTAFDAASGGTYLTYGSGVGELSAYSDNSGTTAVLQYTGSYQVWKAGGSEQMRLTSTGLGIGTSSPSSTLTVGGGTGLKQAYISGGGYDLVLGASGGALFGFASQAISTVFNTASVPLGIGTNASQPLIFGTGATERMRLDASGNLGLGVTPSAWSSQFKAFEIGTPKYASFGQRLNSTGDLFLGWNAYNDSTGTANANGFKYSNTGDYAALYQMTSSHRWYVAPSGTAGNAISFTQAMTLDSSGNLGVGTTTPRSRLDLGNYGSGSQISWHTDATTAYGTVAIQNSSAAIGLLSALKMGAAANSFESAVSATWAKSAILLDYGNIKFFSNPADTVAYGTAYTPTERARIDSSGNLLVGTTSTLSSFSGARASFVGASGFVAQTNQDASYECGAFWHPATSGNNIFAIFGTEATYTTRGSITYNRSAGLVAYNTTSDYRAKDVSGPLIDSGAVIDSVPVYMGKMKGATQERPMFIAHETPSYAHTGEKDAVDADGNPVYQQMDASALVPVMWAELQSLRARVAQLEGK